MPRVPVVELDTTSVYEIEGCRFESCRGHHEGERVLGTVAITMFDAGLPDKAAEFCAGVVTIHRWRESTGPCQAHLLDTQDAK